MKLTNLIQITEKQKNNWFWDSIARVFQEPRVKNWVFDTIRSRLYSSGIDADGNNLTTDFAHFGHVYAFKTIALKKEKGQKTSNVTLRDRGDFYESYELEVSEDVIMILANFNKPEGHIADNFQASYSSQRVFEAAIAALSDDEFDRLMATVKNLIVRDIRNDMGL